MEHVDWPVNGQTLVTPKLIYSSKTCHTLFCLTSLVLVVTLHQVSPILPHYPLCIYTCVFCLSVASLSCFVRYYQCVSHFSSSCFLVFPVPTFLPVLTLPAVLSLIDSALDYEPLPPSTCPFVIIHILITELSASCVCIWVISRVMIPRLFMPLPTTTAIVPAVKIAKLFLTHPQTYSTTPRAKVWHCVRFAQIEPAERYRN